MDEDFGQSKKNCLNNSNGIGPLFVIVQNVHPGPCPATKWANLWFNPSELLKNLKLNSLKFIGRKLKPQNLRICLISLSPPGSMFTRLLILTTFRISRILIFVFLTPSRMFLKEREPLRNRLKKESREMADPSFTLFPPPICTGCEKGCFQSKIDS